MKDRILYEIINPSDALTMYAPDLVTAGVAVAILGHGQYGVEGTPILFGWDEWFEGNGIQDLDIWLDQSDNLKSVAQCLRSVALGSVEERKYYDAALEAITDDAARKKFIADRNDRRRSSMNDIETRAHKLADACEKALAKKSGAA